MSETQGLQWLTRAYELGFCVVFVQGIEPADLLQRMGADPLRTMRLTRKEVQMLSVANHGYPSDLSLFDDTELRASNLLGNGAALLRVGKHDEWSFAFEENGNHAFSVMSAVSAGTKAVFLLRDANATTLFGYARDGHVLCVFDAGSPGDRSGTHPDILVEEMTRVGLLPAGSCEDSTVAILQIAEELGAYLDEAGLEIGRLVTGAAHTSINR